MSLQLDVDLQRDDFQLQLTGTLPSDGVTAIYGPSGAGKTTLLRWIAGLEKSAAGELRFRDEVWQDHQRFIPTHQRQIAYVFQDARLFPHLNVEGNLAYAYQRRFNQQGPSPTQVGDWLGITALLAHFPGQLSSGQQQRVAIARALLSSPKILLMDEPLGSLDKPAGQKILHHLQALRQHINIPVLYVSHDIEELSRIAQHLLILEQGRMIEQGALMDLCSRLELSLSHEENAASVISASILNHDTHYGLSELAIDSSHRLFLAASPGEINDNIRLRIPARDVSIALSASTDSSILNILPCTIDSIEQTGESRILVRLKLEQQFLLARLTKKSADKLQLAVGQRVYAQIKTAALLNEGSPHE